MREILFRGKRVDNEEWVYGYYAVFTGKNIIYVDWKAHEVMPKSVGQFTGLLDKNGNKIFEGDRVLYDGIIGVVFYNSGICMYMVRFELLRSIYSFDSLDREIEIIGNIHEENK